MHRMFPQRGCYHQTKQEALKVALVKRKTTLTEKGPGRHGGGGGGGGVVICALPLTGLFGEVQRPVS